MKFKLKLLSCDFNWAVKLSFLAVEIEAERLKTLNSQQVFRASAIIWLSNSSILREERSKISKRNIFLMISHKQSTFEIEFPHKCNSLMVWIPFNPSQITFNPSFEMELFCKASISKFLLFIKTSRKQSTFEIEFCPKYNLLMV